MKTPHKKSKKSKHAKSKAAKKRHTLNTSNKPIIEQKTVLFICKGNAFRSIMAEAFYNHYANAIHSRAVSAGVAPAKAINPNTVAIMGEIGIKVKKKKPTKLMPAALKKSDRIVILCEPKICRLKEEHATYWHILDTKPGDIEGMRKIRDFLKERVKAFVEEVEGHTL